MAETIVSLSGKKLEVKYTKKREGDIKHSYSDIGKAMNLLDFILKIKLKESILEMI